jgi:hypothetical protein
MLLAAIFSALLLGHERDNQDASPFVPREEFVKFDPKYRANIAERKDLLRSLQQELFAKASHGSSACSREIYVEAQWLTYYTCDYKAIDAQIERLKQVVQNPGTAKDEKIQAPDGSYAPCHNAWFYKLDRTCDRLTVMDSKQLADQKPLSFLDPINSPAKLTAYLDSKLIWDIPNKGVNNSFELNLAATDLLRLINGHLPSGYRFHPQLRATVENWVAKKWQDPLNGCFGPWYKTNQGILKTVDLSATFHVVDYTDGKISHWPQLISTLFKVKDGRWPQGWLQEGQLSNHHDYDVATLFHKGWHFMTPDQRREARVQIKRMMDHCLKETLNSDGSFKQEDEDTVGETYEFPVMLLSEIGYFYKSERFWTDQDFPEAHNLAKKIAAKIRSQHLEDPESEVALFLLDSAD